MSSSRIPRSQGNDYTREAADKRRQFVQQQTGVALEHVGQYTLDPATLPGNIENFTGIIQMPLGFAGPMRVNGEHAEGHGLNGHPLPFEHPDLIPTPSA